MLYPSTIMNPVLEILVEYAKTNPLITGIAITQSPSPVGVNMGLPVGSIILTSPTADISDLISKVKEKIREYVAFHLDFTNPFRLVLYLGNQYLKCELTITNDQSRLIEYVNKKNRILYDQHGGLQELLLSWSPPLESREDLLNYPIQKFLYTFEAFSNAHRLSDGYQAYYYYNQALHQLVTLIKLLRKGEEIPKSDLPHFFTRNYLSREEQIRFRHLGGSLHLRTMNEAKKKLKSTFNSVLSELEEKSEFPVDISQIIEFCDSIYARDYLWNFRDLARFNPTRIRRSMIFRSASLYNYVNDGDFRDWMRKTRIKAIINLQTDLEIRDRPYPVDFLAQVNYYHIPLIPGVSLDQDGTNLESGVQISFEELYVWVLKHRRTQIKALLDVLSDPENYPVIIHCYAGKDRTGIIAALLHLLVGSKEENIVLDYLVSGAEMREIIIHSVLDYVKTQGGIQEFFISIGVSLAQQSNIVNLIALKNSSEEGLKS